MSETTDKRIARSYTTRNSHVRDRVTPLELAHSYLYKAAAEGRTVVLGFNKYNPVELLSQLKSVLENEGLEEVWEEVKDCGLTKKVDKAWRNRKAADIMSTLGPLFETLRPFVKDYRKFLQDARQFIYDFPSQAGDWETEITDIVSGYTQAYGEQVGGYRPGDPMRGRGLIPPEYEESEIEFPERIQANLKVNVNLWDLPEMLASAVRSQVTDQRAFTVTARQMLKDRNVNRLLAKLVVDGISGTLRVSDDLEEAVEDEVTSAIADATPGGYEVNWSIDSLRRNGKPTAKPTPRGFHLSVPVVVEINVESAARDFDPQY